MVTLPLISLLNWTTYHPSQTTMGYWASLTRCWRKIITSWLFRSSKVTSLSASEAFEAYAAAPLKILARKWRMPITKNAVVKSLSAHLSSSSMRKERNIPPTSPQTKMEPLDFL